MAKYIGAIDQGTTSTRFFIFDKNSHIMAMARKEHKQIYPRAGWVEQDPLEIRDNVYEVMRLAFSRGGISPGELAAIGITNQRETTLMWNRHTGKPCYNAIGWQDTRTDRMIRGAAPGGNWKPYRARTGLPLATYFSGPKARWIQENVEGVRAAVEKGDVLFGTMDTWLTWWLTGGPGKGHHLTDPTNASRTLLMNLETLSWDKELMELWGLKETMLPQIRSSAEIYGTTSGEGILSAGIPVAGILGDQQAALFGQVCFNRGEMKNTYGTGAFLLLNTGEDIVTSGAGLISTVGYKIGKEKAVYALEGSIAVAGALVQWLRDNLGFIESSGEIEALAKGVDDSGGVIFVPAFSGLFAPYWRSDARGILTGLTQYVDKRHIARAALEAAAFRTTEICRAMEQDTGIKIPSLKVDGGMTANGLLMQFQSDLLGVKIIRPEVAETTVLGAAYAAGLAVGYWKDKAELRKNWNSQKEWNPGKDSAWREGKMENWKEAVKRSFGQVETYD